MTNLQFDRNRKRVAYCPCDKSNKDGKFVPYIGYDDKGHCHSCGKTFLPELEYTKREPLSVYGGNPKKVEAFPVPSRFPQELAEQTMKGYDRNHFAGWLRGMFGDFVAEQLAAKYRIGTSKHWDGATIFWYYDLENECRSGKIMLYDAHGHRVKQPFSHCTWSHSAAKLAYFDFAQCFYGEHLLQESDAPVAIVESEKTAIVASVYFPDFTWISCGGADGLTTSKCSALEGRRVHLYPDIGKYDLWSEKSVELEGICASVIVSGFLEKNTDENDKTNGYDIADYLVRFSTSAFAKPKAQPAPVVETGNDELFTVYPITDGEEFVYVDWQEYCTDPKIDVESILSEIDEIEAYFASVELPKGTVRLNAWSTTDDMEFCVRISIERARSTVRNYHVGRMCMERLRGLVRVMG